MARRPLRGMFSSVDIPGGIRMDLKAIELGKIDMGVLNAPNRGLVTIAMMRGGQRLVQRVQAEIDKQGLIDSGQLRASIRVTDMNNDTYNGVSLAVGTDVYYAQYVNNGTRGPIVPKNYPVLVLGGSRYREGKPHGPKVFAHSVGGQKAYQFFENALRNANIADFSRRDV
jgi:hypothetical protein